MTAIAWTLIALPLVVGLYAYVLYPLILRLVARQGTLRTEPPTEWPLVTIAVPAYNEEAQIRGAVEALLAQTYPADRRQILVLSDASTDDTDRIVREYETRGVELLRMPVRAGKTAAENASCAHIRGSIVVNTDASIRLHPDMVRQLILHMQDPDVGVASSRDVSISALDATANQAEAGYVGYEMMVRALETRAGGIVGASGSGYAIRTELHMIPIRADLSRDFSAALTARMNGYRAVSVDEAICYVPRTAALSREYRRKVRTISRGMETLFHNRRLLDPELYGTFSLKLISHKVLRWIVPHSAVLGFIGLVLLARHSWLAAALSVLAVVLCAIPVAVSRMSDGQRVPRLFSLVAFAMAANVAVIHASWRFILGHEDHIWEPTRRASAPAGGAVS